MSAPAPLAEADFKCPVCLDLVFKPVVAPSCGHVLCSWCLHRSMSGYGPSRCVLDRSPFTHMPAVNRALHTVLALTFPDAYSTRAAEVGAEEAVTGPSEDTGPLPSGRAVAPADLACAACRGFVTRPVALNCGCTVCASCIPPGRLCVACGATAVVQRPPAVCAALAGAAAALFPGEAAAAAARPASTAVVAVEEGEADDADPTSVERPFPHYGIGCDACGQYPIVGRRYTCTTCARATPMGFDVCGLCADAGAGARQTGGDGGASFRFGQRHAPDHELTLVPPTRTALHAMAEAHPELTMDQLLALIRLAATRDPPDRPGDDNDNENDADAPAALPADAVVELAVDPAALPPGFPAHLASVDALETFFGRVEAAGLAGLSPDDRHVLATFFPRILAFLRDAGPAAAGDRDDGGAAGGERDREAPPAGLEVVDADQGGGADGAADDEGLGRLALE